MKRTKRSSFKAVGLGVAGLAAAQGVQATTEITFEGFTGDNVDISTLPGYGSNVSASNSDYAVSLGATGVLGTPDITLTWGVGYQTYTAWDGRGNVAQTDFNFGNPITLTLTPSASTGVLITSFNLDEWDGGGVMSVSWDISDTSGSLASGTWNKDDPGGRDTVVTGLTLGDVNVGAPVTLSFNLNSGLVSYIALDNLIFDQVPEPSTLALALLGGVGLGAAAMRRRRR